MTFAVMGAGFWARYQLFGWGEVSGVAPVAVCDPDRGKAGRLAEQFGIERVYGDVEAMLDEVRPDFLDIISNVESHAVGVAAALRGGIPVICQKPMGRDLGECEGMVAEAGAVPFFVHENWRYQAPIQELRRVLDSGEIGDAFRARIQFSCSFPVFENQPALAELDQFILTDIGSHILDVARFLFGEASWLLATTSRIGPIRGEDVATVIMGMERCPTVTCQMSYASRMAEEAFPETFAVIEGARGSVELRKGQRVVVTTAEGTREWRVELPAYAWADPAYAQVHGSIVACNRALYRALSGEAEGETTAQDNLRTMRLVFGSYESAKTGEVVRL